MRNNRAKKYPFQKFLKPSAIGLAPQAQLVLFGLPLALVRQRV